GMPCAFYSQHVVVMFDEKMTSLVKCSVDNILAAEDQVRVRVECCGTTPHRVELKDSDAEASFVADTQSGTVDGGTSSKKKRNKSRIVDDSDME
nr:hypothetical protein [Tanacetum cinerariifolium]